MKLPKCIDKIYFGHLVVGIKDFIHTNDIGKSLIIFYYNNLYDNSPPYVCDLCPLNDKFGIESAGCNHFLKELGYRNAKLSNCEEMREIMFYALKEVLYNKTTRFVKI